MNFSPIILAIFSLAYGSNTSETSQQMHAISGAQGALGNVTQAQNILIQKLKSNNGSDDVIGAFINGSDALISQAIATVNIAATPLTFNLSKAVGNYLLDPFVQSVTNGAQVFVDSIADHSDDALDAEIEKITADYKKLIDLSKMNNVDASQLEVYASQLLSTVPKAKRTFLLFPDIFGVQNTVNNAAQTQNQYANNLQQLNNNNPDQFADALTNFITGTDDQVDQIIGICGNLLAPCTFGLSKVIANVILGPFIQSITNAIEVCIGHLVGGLADHLKYHINQLIACLQKLLNACNQWGVSAGNLPNMLNQLKQFA